MTEHERNPVLVIAGPTASGKSALAIRLAQELKGVIINADSMQVYRDLRVLTARPSEAEEQTVEHRLYGYLDAGERCSAWRWREDAIREIEDVYKGGRRPIVVGGTGFYIEALTRGLSPIPDVPEALIASLHARVEAEGVAFLHAAVQQVDPALAARVEPADRQRLMRALAVYEASGRPLSEWQKLPPGPSPFQAKILWLNPPREALYARCNARLEAMLNQGALEEVTALLARGLDPALPAMKALGMAELGALARGELASADALAAAQQATRRFAKRQLTWFRNRFGNEDRHDAQFSESLSGKILRKIQKND